MAAEIEALLKNFSVGVTKSARKIQKKTERRHKGARVSSKSLKSFRVEWMILPQIFVTVRKLQTPIYHKLKGIGSQRYFCLPFVLRKLPTCIQLFRENTKFQFQTELAFSLGNGMLDRPMEPCEEPCLFWYI